jgi:hypothetical protein
MSSDVGIRLNGSVTDNFRLAPGQSLVLSGPSAASTNPLSSASIATTASPGQTELLLYWLLGD